MGLTKDLCQIIHATRYESLGAAAVDRVKQVITDGIAVALAGCNGEPIAILADHMKSLGGAPQASVWGRGFKLPAGQAAYVNAAATHVLDFEPMWSPPTHQVSTTMPLAFALAETRSLTGKHIITAVAKGIEIQGRLQLAGNQHVPEKFRFHPPGVAGVLGSAVVASDLLQLDPERMRHALGIASSRAGALMANQGSMSKCSHCGNAAAAGLEAAQLAARGFTANPDIIEAPRGLAAMFYPDGFDADKLLAWGKPFRVVDPGPAIKLFPSQYGTHYAITAGLELHGRIPDPSRIARVRITAPVMRAVNHPQPEDGHHGKFSIHYTTAAALLDGAVTIETFTDERRFRPDMVGLLAKTTLVQDPAIPGNYHEMHVTVEVELADGTRLNATCKGPKGTFGAPLARKDHQAKLDDCLGRALPRPESAKLLALLDRLDTLDAKGFASIISILGRKASPQRTPSSYTASSIEKAVSNLPSPSRERGGGEGIPRRKIKTSTRKRYS